MRTMGQQEEENPGDSAAALEYLRRAYDSNREWYKAAETKAQVLLGANGVFVGVVFGAILGRPSEARAVVSVFGVETWVFLSLAIVAIVGAVLCAAQTMWSLHGSVSVKELALLLESENGSIRCKPAALWYFGYLGRIDSDVARRGFEALDGRSEIESLRYHLPSLSQRVLRKYWYMNLGWLFTAMGLALVVLAAGSIVVRSA